MLLKSQVFWISFFASPFIRCFSRFSNFRRVTCENENRKYFLEREHPGVCQVLKDFDVYFGENSSCENWPTTFFEKFDVPNVTLEDVMYEYGKENLALVHLVIQSPYVTKIKQDIAVTFTTYVANTGKDFLALLLNFFYLMQRYTANS